MRPQIAAMSNHIPQSDGDDIEQLVHAGLAQTDGRDVYAQLAQAVPSLENGLWKLFDDGRMETTWKIRQDARWHDGTPITADDFVFGTQVQTDPATTIAAHAGYRLIDSVEASDPTTVVVTWKQTYIEAISMFGHPDRLMPRHLLEQPYRGQKERLLDHPYWGEAWVGAGPFKVREYDRGSHVVLDAFDGYVLGRPKLDVVEIRFIPDPATLTANLLAGTVDQTMSANLAPDQVVSLMGQWRDGAAILSPYPSSTVATMPQMLEPALPLVLDVRFRRALIHALDREEMVQTIMMGRSSIAHSPVGPVMPEYDLIQSFIVKYDYDPRETAQLMEEIGYRKSSDGFYEDAAGQRISFEHWGVQEEEERVRGTIVSTDYWRKAGIDAQLKLIPFQQARDASLMAPFPAFLVRGIKGDTPGMQPYFHSSNIATRENGFRGNNRARYAHPQVDAALDRWATTIPLNERARALGEFVRHTTDQVTFIGFYYESWTTLVNNKVKNVFPSNSLAKTFNAHLWDLGS